MSRRNGLGGGGDKNEVGSWTMGIRQREETLRKMAVTNLSGELLAWSLASGRFTSGLLGTSHGVCTGRGVHR